MKSSTFGENQAFAAVWLKLWLLTARLWTKYPCKNIGISRKAMP